MKPLWPHQVRAMESIREAIAYPGMASVVCAPTSAGKSRIMSELSGEWAAEGLKTLILSNRRLLTGQLSGNLSSIGVDHGMMAAGWTTDFDQLVQVASIQTIDSRVYRNKWWEPFDADRVIVDEAHLQKNGRPAELIKWYKDRGVPVVGFTATPVWLGGLYDHMITPATVSELIAAKILVPALEFCPDEPDMQHVYKTNEGEYTVGDVVKRIMVQHLPGRILKWFHQLNPLHYPTICFGPCVKSSIYLCDQFNQAGIAAAHMDADTSPEERDRIIEQHRAGEIKIICNRWLLREAIDLPWVRHMIFATVIGAESNWVQMGGRGMRRFPDKEVFTVQDHGGNARRHGSLNDDRDWELGETDVTRAAKKKKRQERGEEKEPILCPQCHHPRPSGLKCPNCGHEHKLSVRVVVQHDGTLKPLRGATVKPKRQKSEAEKRAASAFWPALKLGRTVAQMAMLYRRKHGEAFPDGVVRHNGSLVVLPPEGSVQWRQKVSDVFA